MKKQFELELEEIEAATSQSFSDLKKDVDAEAKTIEGSKPDGKLTYEEMKAVSKLKEDISEEADKIEKKIRKVEKDIERS